MLKEDSGREELRELQESGEGHSFTYCCATQEIDKVMAIISKITAVTLLCNPKTKDPGLDSHLSFMHPKYLICTRCSVAWSC